MSDSDEALCSDVDDAASEAGQYDAEDAAPATASKGVDGATDVACSDADDGASDTACSDGSGPAPVQHEQPKSPSKRQREEEPGIIYLSKVPQYMGVKKVRQIFGQYGEIGRIFLQPDMKQSKKKKSRLFTEGWVEFLNKRLAKRVALSLNNTIVGGKRRSIWYEELWNLKYLKGFKWGHLNERLAYEKAVHQQRMRTEIALAKKEANFYAENLQKLQIMKKLEKKPKKSTTAVPQKEWTYKQRKTDEMQRKKPPQKTLERIKGDKAYLRSIFGSRSDEGQPL